MVISRTYQGDTRYIWIIESIFYFVSTQLVFIISYVGLSFTLDIFCLSPSLLPYVYLSILYISVVYRFSLCVTCDTVVSVCFFLFCVDLVFVHFCLWFRDYCIVYGGGRACALRSVFGLFSWHWLCVHSIHIHRWFTFERWWLFYVSLYD